eukprot:UN22713
MCVISQDLNVSMNYNGMPDLVVVKIITKKGRTICIVVLIRSIVVGKVICTKNYVMNGHCVTMMVPYRQNNRAQVVDTVMMMVILQTPVNRPW